MIHSTADIDAPELTDIVAHSWPVVTAVMVAALAIVPPSYAQKPSIAQQAPYAAAQGQRDKWEYDGARDTLCANVLAEYPADHLILLVRGQPLLHIDCGAVPSQSPVHLTFRTVTDLNWYRTHKGHRSILPGEGPGD